MRRVLAVAVGVSLVLVVGCSNDSAPGGDGANYPTKPMTIYSGFDPGGGIDLAINTVIRSVQEAKTVSVPLHLAHQPGGSGLTAAAKMASDHNGAEDTLFLTSVSTLSASLRQDGGVTLKDLVPLSGLFAEYTYVYVRKDSRFQTLTDLANALKAEPKGIKISGASLGSADTIVVAQFARALGLSFEGLVYLPLTGGQNEANLLGGQVDVAFGGPDLLKLVDSGDVRVLAVSSAEPLSPAKVANIPTFKSLGYDVAQANWRGVFGPPGMPDYAVDFWSRTLSGLGDNEVWKQALETNVWDAKPMDSAAFAKFLSDEEGGLKAGLTDLGLLN